MAIVKDRVAFLLVLVLPTNLFTIGRVNFITRASPHFCLDIYRFADEPTKTTMNAVTNTTTFPRQQIEDIGALLSLFWLIGRLSS